MANKFTYYHSEALRYKGGPFCLKWNGSIFYVRTFICNVPVRAVDMGPDAREPKQYYEGVGEVDVNTAATPPLITINPMKGRPH